MPYTSSVMGTISMPSASSPFRMALVFSTPLGSLSPCTWLVLGINLQCNIVPEVLIGFIAKMVYLPFIHTIMPLNAFVNNLFSSIWLVTHYLPSFVLTLLKKLLRCEVSQGLMRLDSIIHLLPFQQGSIQLLNFSRTIKSLMMQEYHQLIFTPSGILLA